MNSVPRESVAWRTYMTGSPVVGGATMIGVLACLVVLAFLFRATLGHLISIWRSTATYTHCFFVPAISAWFVWRIARREALSAPGCWWPGLALVAGVGILWWLARLAQLALVEQLALVGMFQCSAITLLGPALSRQIRFPLLLLFFIVPFGDELVPLLVRTTADFTVWAIRLSGIPVFQDGVVFSLPSGDFLVDKACSGVRYLTASLLVALIYAHLRIHSLRWQLAFIAVATALPIAANALRAYAIVMLAHISEMRIAAGVDHVIYGWLFFGLVVLLLIWIGSYFSRRAQQSTMPTAQGASATADTRAPTASAGSAAMQLLAATAVMSVLVVISVGGDAVEHRLEATLAAAVPALPRGQGSWQGPAQGEPWAHSYAGSTRSLAGRYSSAGHEVALTIAFLEPGARDRDLESAASPPFDAHVWRQIKSERVVLSLPMGARSMRARLITLESATERGLVLFWHDVSGKTAAGVPMGKLLSLRMLLSGKHRGTAAVMLSAPAGDFPRETQQALEQFAGEHAAAVGLCLWEAEQHRDICYGGT